MVDRFNVRKNQSESYIRLSRFLGSGHIQQQHQQQERRKSKIVWCHVIWSELDGISITQTHRHTDTAQLMFLISEQFPVCNGRMSSRSHSNDWWINIGSFSVFRKFALEFSRNLACCLPMGKFSCVFCCYKAPIQIVHIKQQYVLWECLPQKTSRQTSCYSWSDHAFE